MTEADIAAQVASRIPREPVATVTSPSAPQDIPQLGDEGYVFQNPLDELSMYKIYNFFDIPINDRSNPEMNNMITKMVEWAYESGATEYYDIIKVIRDAQRITGTSSIKSAYQFAKIDMQSRKLAREMSALYG